LDTSKINTITFPELAGEIPDKVNFKIDKASAAINKLNDSQYTKTLSKVIKVKDAEDISKRKEKLKEIFDIAKTTQENKDQQNNLSSFRDSNKKLDVYNDGIFTYNLDTDNNSKENLLGDDKIRKLASDFLSKNNLISSDYYFDAVQYETVTPTSDPDKSIVLRKFVNFTRKINGQPVYGYSKISVGINAVGEISNVYYLGRDLADSSDVEIKDFDKAFTDLNEQNGLVKMESDTKDVEIKNVELAYWEDSTPNSTQNYIQPVYRFTGDAINGKGDRSEFVAIIRAISENKTSTVNPKSSNLESTPKIPKN